MLHLGFWCSWPSDTWNPSALLSGTGLCHLSPWLRHPENVVAVRVLSHTSVGKRGYIWHHICNLRMETEATTVAIAWLVEQQICHAVAETDSQRLHHKIDKALLRRKWTNLLSGSQVTGLTTVLDMQERPSSKAFWNWTNRISRRLLWTNCTRRELEWRNDSDSNDATS